MLHPLRILCIMAWAWLGWRFVPATARWLRSRWAKPLVLLGQHPLEVFASSVLLSVLGEAVLVSHPGSTSQILVQSLGSLALLASAAIFAVTASTKQKSRAPSPVPSQPEQTPQPELVAV
jgi:hypothetical protein